MKNLMECIELCSKSYQEKSTRKKIGFLKTAVSKAAENRMTRCSPEMVLTIEGLEHLYRSTLTEYPEVIAEKLDELSATLAEQLHQTRNVFASSRIRDS